MQKKIIAGNWKMNTTLESAILLASEIDSRLTDSHREVDNVTVILFPPFPFIPIVADVINADRISVGSQNIANQPKGAFTGEVSAEMIASIGVKYTIIGHSERRAFYGETNKILSQKIDLALENNLDVVFCCGEKLEERESGQYFEVIRNQLIETIFKLSSEKMQHIVIAYEPIWAIGTGKTATPEQAQEIHAFIRNLLKKNFGETIADTVSILYGGSCKPANAKELFSQSDIDGGLIGGASLKAEDFVQIIESY